MTNEQKSKISENFIFYLPAKNSRTDVSVVMPKKLKSAFLHLLSREKRLAAGVPEDNQFVFPSLHLESYCSGWHDAAEVCIEAGVNMNATKLRHYVATQAGFSDLTDSEMQAVHKHMGHSKQIHDSIYKCPGSSKTILIANKMAESLYNTDDSVENNTISSNDDENDPTLDDLVNSDIDDPDAVNSIVNEDEGSSTCKPYNFRVSSGTKNFSDEAENSVASAEPLDISVDSSDDDWHPSEDGHTSRDGHPSEDRDRYETPKKKVVQRKNWNYSEKRKIRDTFANFIYDNDKTTSPRPTTKNFKILANSGCLPTIANENTPQKVNDCVPRFTIINGWRRIRAVVLCPSGFKFYTWKISALG